MAVSLGFGVLFATLITLVLVPTAYMILDDVGRTMRRVLGSYRPVPDVGVDRVWRVDAGPPCGDAYMETSRAVRVVRYDSSRPPAGHAGGKRVEHRHGLDRLWRQPEAVSGFLPAVLAEADLQHLTKYGGEFRYPAPGSRQLDPAATWRIEAPARAVVAHAERTVPGLVERTKARIAEE